jgi:phosphoribosyl-AMP cyclohydrolase
LCRFAMPEPGDSRGQIRFFVRSEQALWAFGQTGGTVMNGIGRFPGCVPPASHS